MGFLDHAGLTYLWGKVKAALGLKMDASVYDPTGKGEDVFGYADAKAAAAENAAKAASRPVEWIPTAGEVGADPAGTAQGIVDATIPWELETEAPVLENMVVSGSTHYFDTPLSLVDGEQYYLAYDAGSSRYEHTAIVKTDTEGPYIVADYFLIYEDNIHRRIVSSEIVTIKQLSKITTFKSIPPYLMAGEGCTVYGECAHAEGAYTKAGGSRSHAEGYSTSASGDRSHAEGRSTTASGDQSHAEGRSTRADGDEAHAEGKNTIADGKQSHAEGSTTTASGSRSHAEGTGTAASSHSQHAQGKYNAEDAADKYAHIVGNGADASARSNAHTLDWSGNGWFAGDVFVGGTGQDDPAAVKLARTAKSLAATLLASAWTGSAAPFTQTVSVADLTADANGTIGLSQSATAAQRAAAREAMLCVTGQASGSLTVTADGEKPTVDIPVTVTILG